jgi:hypothetical protein
MSPIPRWSRGHASKLATNLAPQACARCGTSVVLPRSWPGTSTPAAGPPPIRRGRPPLTAFQRQKRDRTMSGTLSRTARSWRASLRYVWATYPHTQYDTDVSGMSAGYIRTVFCGLHCQNATAKQSEGFCLQLSDDEIEELQPKAPKRWWQAWWWRLFAISVSLLIFCGGVVMRVIANDPVSCIYRGYLLTSLSRDTLMCNQLALQVVSHICS